MPETALRLVYGLILITSSLFKTSLIIIYGRLKRNSIRNAMPTCCLSLTRVKTPIAFVAMKLFREKKKAINIDLMKIILA